MLSGLLNEDTRDSQSPIANTGILEAVLQIFQQTISHQAQEIRAGELVGELTEEPLWSAHTGTTRKTYTST